MYACIWISSTPHSTGTHDHGREWESVQLQGEGKESCLENTVSEAEEKAKKASLSSSLRRSWTLTIGLSYEAKAGQGREWTKK